jgi:hypothetical protein
LAFASAKKRKLGQGARSFLRGSPERALADRLLAEINQVRRGCPATIGTKVTLRTGLRLRRGGHCRHPLKASEDGLELAKYRAIVFGKYLIGAHDGPASRRATGPEPCRAGSHVRYVFTRTGLQLRLDQRRINATDYAFTLSHLSCLPAMSAISTMSVYILRFVCLSLCSQSYTSHKCSCARQQAGSMWATLEIQACESAQAATPTTP